MTDWTPMSMKMSLSIYLISIEHSTYETSNVERSYLEDRRIPVNQTAQATLRTHECRLLRHVYQIYLISKLLCVSHGDLSWSQF